MKTIDIKGRPYIPVVERVKEAHKSDIEIQTELISDTDSQVSFKATVTFYDKVAGDTRTFTGHSSASKTSGMMKDVAMEVAETSAIGRALGFANIGLEADIATADEMRKAPSIKKEDIKSDQDLFEL